MDIVSKGANYELINRFFIKTSHHKNISVIIILQNAFKKELREVNINSQYLIVFDSPRDRSTIQRLASQICPGQIKYLQDAYIKAVTLRKHGYLCMDLHPRSNNKLFWARSHLFPDNDCEVYVSK
jgi:hypothetical protein